MKSTVVDESLSSFKPMYCSREYQTSTRLIQQYEKSTLNVKESPHCQIVKGDYTEPNTILGVIIANNPMDLMCIDFTKVDPLKDGKKTSWF